MPGYRIFNLVMARRKQPCNKMFMVGVYYCERDLTLFDAIEIARDKLKKKGYIVHETYAIRECEMEEILEDDNASSSMMIKDGICFSEIREYPLEAEGDDQDVWH